VNDYERIAGVIRYLDEHQAEQPSLEVLAHRAGVSRFHLHRLFSTWAGVTPKDFLQCLTLERAKLSLGQGRSVLDAALDAGLSGPGRLHDLCVQLESASPGEWKAGGASWEIDAGFVRSPFGDCLIAISPRGICHLSFVETGRAQESWAELEEHWPNSTVRRNEDAVSGLGSRIFSPRSMEEAAEAPLKAFVAGTEFQLRVWRALLRIPRGAVTTYGRLAASLDEPRAARAVGTAVGQNRVAYLIPCHRVIRETGAVGEYRWGSVRKRAMLSWEAAACAA
jgi:AraC family transcriptional regulator of adaptative response/methylated-DNA-[protein]-cysteine methyltransferase